MLVMHLPAVPVLPHQSPAGPAQVDLSWDPDDPLAVSITITSNRTVVWRVGRDLLADGMHHPVGLGDITMIPNPWLRGRVELVLVSREGRAALLLDPVDVHLFLEATWRRVPAGAETVAVPAPEVFAAGVDRDDVDGAP